MSVFRVVVVSFYRYDKRTKRRSEYFVEADSEEVAERIGYHVARRRCWAADDHVVVGLEYMRAGTRTTICEHGDVRVKMPRVRANVQPAVKVSELPRHPLRCRRIRR